MFQKLCYTKLKKCYKNKIAELKYINSSDDFFMGQKRALGSLKYGLNVKAKNHNIYLAGESGLGKSFFAYKYAKEAAKTQKNIYDFVYVYNFKNPNNPKLLTFNSGGGKLFQKEIDNLINCISIKAEEKFNSLEYLNEKNEIIKKYQRLQDKSLNNISKVAQDRGLQIKINKNTFYFIPTDNEEISSEEDFFNLPFEKKEEYGLIIS